MIPSSQPEGDNDVIPSSDPEADAIDLNKPISGKYSSTLYQVKAHGLQTYLLVYKILLQTYY